MRLCKRKGKSLAYAKERENHYEKSKKTLAETKFVLAETYRFYTTKWRKLLKKYRQAGERWKTFRTGWR
jgi:hypothetical protein